jgi:hypothetical protein
LVLQAASFPQQRLKIYLNGVKEVGDHFGKISGTDRKIQIGFSYD